MSVRFTLTDQSFPVSGAFLDFVCRKLEGSRFEDVDWLDQVTEKFTANRSIVDSMAKSNASAVLSSSVGRKVIEELYQVLTWILSGDSLSLAKYFKGYRFVWIVGAPRTGGTFLLNRALQHYRVSSDLLNLPAFVVHDGTPDIAYPGPVRSVNVLAHSAMQMAELAIAIKLLYPSPCVVVKKALKYAFAGPLFDSVFGEPYEVVVTVREPLPVAWSVMQKCKLKYGKYTRSFRIHCPIDELVQNLCLTYFGLDFYKLRGYSYASAVCMFWSAFYQLLASSLTDVRNVEVVAFGESMADFVKRYPISGTASSALSDFVMPVLPVLPFSEEEWEYSHDAVTSVTNAFTRAGRSFPALSTV
ncbi:MAG: hypothetical protein ACYDB9_06020 [Gammaproteobacteria bacterium]